MSALFPDLVELFTPAPKENAKNASTPSLSGKSKQVYICTYIHIYIHTSSPPALVVHLSVAYLFV